MSALSAIDQSEAPEGYEWRWEPVKDGNGYSGDWRPVSPEESMPCRWMESRRSCKRPSVAKLDRARNPQKRRWWHYCEDHMYGRVLVDGVIYSSVLRPLVGDA